MAVDQPRAAAALPVRIDRDMGARRRQRPPAPPQPASAPTPTVVYGLHRKWPLPRPRTAWRRCRPPRTRIRGWPPRGRLHGSSPQCALHWPPQGRHRGWPFKGRLRTVPRGGPLQATTCGRPPWVPCLARPRLFDVRRELAAAWLCSHQVAPPCPGRRAPRGRLRWSQLTALGSAGFAAPVAVRVDSCTVRCCGSLLRRGAGLVVGHSCCSAGGLQFFSGHSMCRRSTCEGCPHSVVTKF